ncbi:DUF292-domain-containing protein [Neocallimastix lanati (nom. inval.)]|uniref:DUF292-domain-containing protein n=1 Tax=Neocallimastix californiae TaxID=1754190 RepID=A0A1Y2DKT2_9FUNG|nr:DUF292-domain-containing protein [Neocallimastix sp. JGI-2020a]ORY59355.1 DUF292-domain-containing protein [Neocallimastix californiae]|eukprot:ORY59355.1 DUF292-domain-containing protein [Neocallimastix californiae]
MKKKLVKSKFNPNKTKVSLKLAIARLRLLQSKKSSINNTAKKEISTLLENGKEASARIRVEQIIKEDYNIEVLEVLELFCELLVSRYGLLLQSNDLDNSIAEAVKSIAYAAPRYDIKELNDIHKELVYKFGMEINDAPYDNYGNEIHPKIYNFFKNETPSKTLVNKYLTEIANIYKIKWECPPEEEEEKNKEEVKYHYKLLLFFNYYY